MVDSPKKSPECGVNGVPCGAPERYPVCDFRSGDKGELFDEFMVRDDGIVKPSIRELKPEERKAIEKNKKLPEGYRPPIERDNPKTAEKNESEIDAYIHFRIPGKKGYSGICRSELKHELFVRPFNPKTKTYDEAKKVTAYRWYLHSDRASHLVFRNAYDQNKHANFSIAQNRPIRLVGHEMYALAEVLDLNEGDVVIAPGGRPKDFNSVGTYYFDPNPHKLQGIIDKLKNSFLLNKLGEMKFDDDRRLKLVDELKGLKDKIEEPMKFQRAAHEGQEYMKTYLLLGLAGTGLLVFFIGYHPVKDLIGKIRGRVRTTDFSKIIRERLKLNRLYDVAGRDMEAELGWKMTDSLRTRHVIIDTPTGIGKDKVVEKMLIMKEKGEPVVPQHFRKAPVLKINAAEFQAQTSLRGNVADKVAEIARKARKGPVIIYISEIDMVFLSGSSMSGDTEAVGKLLLDVLEDPSIKKNLIILGTTSRGQAMIARYPDLERRFNWMGLREFTLSEVVDIIDESTRMQFEVGYKVQISHQDVELAARLAERYYRKQTGMPRFDAVLTILEDAARLARDRGANEMIEQYIIGATEERCGTIIDQAELEEIKEKDLDSLMVDVKPGEGVASQPEVSPGAAEVKATEEATAEANELAGVMKQVRDLVEGVSPAERVRLAEDLLRTWKSLSDNERVRITQEGIRMGGGEGPLPEHWIKETLARGAEGVAGRGVKGVGRERERPEDRDRKIREGAKKKGKGMLDHMPDPRKPKSVK